MVGTTQNLIQIASQTDERQVAHCLIKTHARGTSNNDSHTRGSQKYRREADTGNQAAAEGRRRADVCWAVRNNYGKRQAEEESARQQLSN